MIGSRGQACILPLHAIFNYILKLLYLGCQWRELPIKTDKDGRPEIHYSRICRMFQYCQKHGCIDAIFTGSVSLLHQAGQLV